MADAYGDNIREAAKTLHIEGLLSREIKERFEDGNAGLPFKVTIAQRTIDGWRRTWKREGIRAASIVRAGDEESTENAIYRRILGVCRLALTELENQEQAGKVDPALVKRIGDYQSIIDAARAKRAIVAKRKAGHRLTQEEAGEGARDGDKAGHTSMLDKLAAKELDGPGKQSKAIETQQVEEDQRDTDGLTEPQEDAESTRQGEGSLRA